MTVNGRKLTAQEIFALATTNDHPNNSSDAFNVDGEFEFRNSCQT